MSAIAHARSVLLVSALAFAGPGLGFLLAPAAFAGLVDLRLLGPTGFADVRAVLGGLELSLAGVLLWSAAAPARFPLGLGLALATLGGLAAGRVASLVLDGPPSAFGWLLGAVEAALLVGAVTAGWRLRCGPDQLAARQVEQGQSPRSRRNG